MPRSVDNFQSRIAQFQRVRTQGEKKGRISQTEMQQALAELAGDGKVTKSELKAAKDLFKSDTDMTHGSRELLAGFIEQFAPSSGPSHGTGVRGISTVAEMKNLLKDPGFLDGVFQSAFGNAALSRSSSKEVGQVKKLQNGNFEVDIQLVHWRTRGVMHEGTVELNPAGSVVSADVDQPQDPRDAKIAADGPIGPRGGNSGVIFKVRADDPIPSQPADPRPDPRDTKITADGPIGGRRPGGHVFKVRADDPIPNTPAPSTPAPRNPTPRRPTGGPPGGVFKIRADDPI